MNFSFLPQFWSYFNYGVLVTIMISVCVVFFGTILGVLVSLAKRSGIKPLEWLVSLYVWVFRGTPMVVQIMIAFNLIHIESPNCSVWYFKPWFVTYRSRYYRPFFEQMVLIFLRVCVQVSSLLPKGQVWSLPTHFGIRPWNTMRYVVLPQAIKNILSCLG